MVTVSLAFLAGVSAAFGAWLSCVAYSDVFLALFPAQPVTVGGRRSGGGHERSA